MDNLFNEFEKPTKDAWKAVLIKELRGESEELLSRKDEIEEIEYQVYQADSDISQQDQALSTSTGENTWINIAKIVVDDAKKANTKALELLNYGVDGLEFDFKTEDINLKVLLNDIRFEFITSWFTPLSFNQYEQLIEFLAPYEEASFFFNLDFIGNPILIGKDLPQQRNSLLSDGYSIQQCGANTWQEIAYLLACGNEYLSHLSNQGFKIDDVVDRLHFRIGIGANYFYEIAKIRAFKSLWALIIEQYEPQYQCSKIPTITASCGFVNKSLLDPHTNLLRQTTEVMSALSGGVNAIVVSPYDALSNKPTELAERMALNIPLILKEESYFDKVIDPLAGSYTINELTDKIASKAWEYFQLIESYGGISSEKGINLLRKDVSNKADQRIAQIIDKSKKLIGVNIFPNPQKVENMWDQPVNYLGMNHLILEAKQIEALKHA